MIYDYEECQKHLDKYKYTIIKEVEPIGYTSLEKLPIRCFKLGEGKNNIVVSASQHSNEIISTTFVIYLMNYLVKNNIVFEDLSIYFIPILNPEGYIVNTSAIRDKISVNASQRDIIRFSKEYHEKYMYDRNNSNEIKLHQEMFNDTNYKSIDNKYNILKDSVGEILSNHPKGSIIDWASNGNGIDLNSNSSNKKVSQGQYNRAKAIDNIRIDIPSPIGYPGDTDSKDFEQELEVQSLKRMFEDLNKDNNLLGFLNYHSAGGVIYQRPEDNNNLFSITYNYLLSKFYQENTVKNNFVKNLPDNNTLVRKFNKIYKELFSDSKYRILTNASGNITSVNDSFRVEYPGNLLIELSYLLGNPLSSFAKLNNFKNTIDNNIESFIYTMNNITKVYSESKELIQDIENADDIYSKVDDRYKYMK